MDFKCKARRFQQQKVERNASRVFLFMGCGLEEHRQIAFVEENESENSF